MPVKRVMKPMVAARKKKRILSPNGTISSERTITIGTGNGYINIPTIWKGKQLSKVQAIQRAKKSGTTYKKFKTIKEAVQAAGARSKALGQAGKELDKIKRLRGLQKVRKLRKK